MIYLFHRSNNRSPTQTPNSMKTSRVFISQFQDVPYFHSRFGMVETFRRMRAAELPFLYSVRLSIWWKLRCLYRGYSA